MDGTIEKEEYDGKMAEYNARLNRQIAEKEILAENSLKKKSINRRILKADQKVVAINNRERYKEKQKEIKRRNRV